MAGFKDPNAVAAALKKLNPSADTEWMSTPEPAPAADNSLMPTVENATSSGADVPPMPGTQPAVAMSKPEPMMSEAPAPEAPKAAPEPANQSSQPDHVQMALDRVVAATEMKKAGQDPSILYTDPTKATQSKTTDTAATEAAPPVEAGPPAPPATQPQVAPSEPAAQPRARPAAPKAPAPKAPAPRPPKQSYLEPIGTRSYNPNASTREVMGNIQESKAHGLNLVDEQGKIADEYETRRMGHEILRSQAANETIDKQRETYARQNARAEETREQTLQEMDDLKKKIGKPPFDTVGLVFGLISTLAAGGNESGRAAAPFIQQLGKAVNHRMQTYAAEVEAGKTHLEGLGKVINQDRFAAMDENQRAEALTKAVGAEFDNALEDLQAHAKSELDVNKYKTARNLLFQQLEGGILKQRQAQAAAQRTRELRYKFANAKSQEEFDAIANSSAEAAKMARDILKTKSDAAGLEKKIADIDKVTADTELAKAKAAAEGKAVHWSPVGFKPPEGLTDAEARALTAKVSDKTLALGALKSYYRRLGEVAQQIAKSGVTDFEKLSPTLRSEVNDLRVSGSNVKNHVIGAGMPTGKEFERALGTLDNPVELVKLVNSEKALEAGLRNAQNAYDQGLLDLRYTRESPDEANQRGAQGAKSTLAGGGSDVVDVTIDGVPYRMPRSHVDAIRKTSSSDVRIQGEDEPDAEAD